MCDNKKDKTCGEPNKSSFQQAEDGSILIASLLKFKKGKKDIRMKKHKSKVTSSQDGIGTTLSKTGGTDTLETGIENDFIIGELIHKKVVNKALNKKSSWKAPSMDRKGKDSTIMVSDNNGETIKDGVMVKKRRKRKKKKRNNVELDEPSRLQRRVRYLVIKMKLEQNLIDAYSGEGWKGQSREKIRPEKELIRAKKQIQMCKLGIREAVNQLDSLSKVGCIEDSVMAPDGSVSHEHIFCAKCKSNEIFPDNDIVLCDGTCNCAFHQNCLDPPLDTANIPPDNQGWFCKFCECRIEIIEAINAHLGTQFSLNSNWEDIFEEAVVTNDTLLLNPEDEWPSDDSADDDYDPERQNSTSSAGTDDDTSTPSSLSWSLDGEGFSGSRCQIEGIDLKNSYVLESDDASEGEIIFYHRQRRAVDYKKLYDEMFGKDAAGSEQFSDDEDWGPGKRRRREKEADAASTLITLGASERKSDKDQANVQKKIQSDTQSRNPSSRIPASAVEKLREIFAENELPSRTTRENISKELGLEPGKVNKWFKNARYLALKSRKQAGTTEGQENASPKLSREDESDFMENTADDLAEGPNVEVVLALKRQKKVRKRKTSKPNNSSNNIKEQDTAGESPANCNKVIDGSEDVCLKKLLKAKRKKWKKPVSPISSMAEAEMERLCKAKNRIQNLRFMLLRLENGRKKNNDNQLEEPIVYVPVAELREKV